MQQIRVYRPRVQRERLWQAVPLMGPADSGSVSPLMGPADPGTATPLMLPDW